MFKKNTVLSSLFWKFSERILTQVINIIVQVVLARKIGETESFAELAIILVFVNYATVFVQSGISTYIIQKNTLDDDDVSAVLFVTLMMATVMYSILFFCAPYIATYYDGMENLKVGLRIIAFSLFPSSINSVCSGILARRMDFRSIFLRSLVVVPIAGAVGIGMAMNGFGLFALVTHHILNQFLTAVVMAFGVGKVFYPKFDLRRVKPVISFGGNVLAQSFIVQVVESFRTLIIGKKYTEDDLAYYDKGQTYTNYLYSGISSTLASVLLPTLTSLQDDRNEMKNVSKRFLSVGMFVVAPALALFSATSSNWVPLFLTPIWNLAVPYIAVFSVVKLAGLFVTVNMQILYALGRVDTTRRLVTIECIASVLILVMTYKAGVKGIAFGCIVVSIADIVIFSAPNKSTIDYSLFDQLKDGIPSIILSGLVYIIIRLLGFMYEPNILLLFAQLAVGTMVYFGVSYLFQREALMYLLKCSREMIDKVRKNVDKL